MIRVLPVSLLVLLAFCFTGRSCGGESAEQPARRKLVVAYESTEYYPWSMPSGDGVDLQLLKETAKKHDFDLEFLCIPWTECLKRIKENSVHAVLNASYSFERSKFCVYPLKDGALQKGLRTHFDGYCLYRVKGCKAEFKNGKLTGFTGKVAAQKSFSVVRELRGAGADVDDAYVSVDEILAAMLEGKVEAAAMMPVTADYTIHSDKKFDSIEKMQLISYKPYFLVFSKKFSDENPKFCWKVWDSIAEFRTSSQYGLWVNRMTSKREKGDGK